MPELLVNKIGNICGMDNPEMKRHFCVKEIGHEDAHKCGHGRKW